MEQKLKLGIAGYGRIVELFHIPIIKKIEELEIVSVYDITESRLSLAGNKGYQTFNDLDEFLDSDMDIVLIATPPHSHYMIAVASLKKNKHLIIEKPITTSVSETLDIKYLAEEVNKNVTVFQNKRYTPDFVHIQNVLQNDELGKIYFVERKYSVYGSPVTFGVKSFNPEWRVKKEYGGGALLDWGIHLIDQLMALNLGKIKSISPFTFHFDASKEETEDYVHAKIILDNDILLNMEVNFKSFSHGPIWTISGDKGTLFIDDKNNAVLYKKENIRKPETITLERESRFNGIEIYHSLVSSILNGGKPAVTMDEIILDMEILETIKNQTEPSEHELAEKK